MEVTMTKPINKKKATMTKPMNKKKATITKPMNNKKKATKKPTNKKRITRTKPMKATPRKHTKKNGMAMKPTKIKNKSGTAMKPKPLKKILANMGIAFSLLVQKAAGGVTSASTGTIATQLRVNHSLHQAKIGTVPPISQTRTGTGSLLQGFAYSR